MTLIGIWLVVMSDFKVEISKFGFGVVGPAELYASSHPSIISSISS